LLVRAGKNIIYISSSLCLSFAS